MSLPLPVTRWPEAKLHVLSDTELLVEFKGQLDGQYTLTLWMVHTAYPRRPDVSCTESHYSTVQQREAGVASRNVTHLCPASVYKASVGQYINGTVFKNPENYTVVMSKLNFYIVIKFCRGFHLLAVLKRLILGASKKVTVRNNCSNSVHGLLCSICQEI